MSHMTMGDEIHGLRSYLASLIEENKCLRTERNALAGHLERLEAAIDNLVDGEPIDEYNRDINGMLAPSAGDPDYQKRAAVTLSRIRNESPETGLFKLKAQWQAEALSELADWINENSMVADALDILHYIEMRRQSEEAT